MIASCRRLLPLLWEFPAVNEGAILSTCNRTEAYVIISGDVSSGRHSRGLSCRPARSLADEFDGHLYCYRDGAAANHLFLVASGINFMILGEPDIQRQVKQALEASQIARSAGTLLNKVFQEALVTSKRARTETAIGRGAFSVGAAAVELATQIFGKSLSGNTVLVLGAGKMSEITAKHLQAKGAPTVIVANRTYEKAVQLAQQFGGKAHHFDKLPQSLLTADIVVCSTAAPHPIVSRVLIKEAMRARHNRPLFLIDIAVPRDVEPSVGDLENVYLYNIDDLQSVVAEARQARATEVVQAREIVEESVTGYLRWVRSLEVAPLIVAVREKLDAARLAELARLRTRLPGLSDKEWRAVEAGMQALTNKIAHPAVMAIKAGADLHNESTHLETIRRAFRLEEEAPAEPGSVAVGDILPQEGSGQ